MLSDKLVKKQNFSRKRQAILEAIQSTKSHPTAEWVYQKLKPEFPNLSLGTVYRNIAQFKEDGLIIGVGIINGQERFDANVAPHGHFICNECGCVVDIPMDYVSPETIATVSQELDAEIESHDLIFYGQCSKCRIVER